MPSWNELPPREQASCPDTPPERLLALADAYSRQVLENPVLPLLLLTDPALGGAIQSAARRRTLVDQIHDRVRRLSPARLSELADEVADLARGSRPALRRGERPAVLVARAAIEAVKLGAMQETVARFEHHIDGLPRRESNHAFVAIELARLEALLERLDGWLEG